MGVAWTKDEDAILRAWAARGIVELQQRLPGRSRCAVKNRAQRLNVILGRLPSGANEWQRGRLAIPPRAHPLVRQIIREANRQKAFLHEIAERAGVARQTISHWRYDRNPELVCLVAVANVLGFDVKLVAQREEREAA